MHYVQPALERTEVHTGRRSGSSLLVSKQYSEIVNKTRPTTSAGQPASSGQEIILIVEDNADVRAYIAEHLQDRYAVLQATNGEDGFAKAQEAIPDLIITDVMMPRIDGYQLTKILREDEKTSHIPVVMVTAKAGEENRIEGLERGVDAYLIKPFSPNELRVRVRKLIEMRRNLRKRFSTATVIKPLEIEATSMDRAFLERVIAVIEASLGDEEFSVETLASEVAMSTSQINRKLNALIGQPASQLIRSTRLQRAADLLTQNAGTVAEIAYRVGFSDQAHFARSFHKQFERSPSKFKQQ
ncbi:MAG: DNA-binding response regulator [Calditrichaeota bacterium]|nr:MAG: DNA-binding response regulator [Calditrichota bacterium]